MQSENNIYWVIDADIIDRAAFDVVMEKMIDTTRGEAGALNYEWNVSADGTSISIFERYADSDAVMAHLAGFAPHAPAFMAAVKPTALAVYGNPDDTVRAALADFGPVYFAPIGGFAR